MTRYYSMPEVAQRLGRSSAWATDHAAQGHTFGSVPARRIGIAFVADADLFDSEFGLEPVELLTTRAVAERLGMNRQMALRKARRGDIDGLPVVRIGYRHFVPVAAAGE